MEREYIFDILALSKYVDFFLHYTHDVRGAPAPSMVPDSIRIFIPDVVPITDSVVFLGFLYVKNDTVTSLLRHFHPRHIFILADFFGVWTIFEDILSLASFRDQHIHNAMHVFLKCALEFYGPYHPFTNRIFTEINISTYFFIRCMAEPNISYNQLRRLSRNCRRAVYYESHVHDHCYLCSRVVSYGNLAVMPCCGTSLHQHCLENHIDLYRKCRRCNTKIYRGEPLNVNESRAIITVRSRIRASLGIPVDARFPALRNRPS